MSRILTGIQSTGTPHLGNILGAIVPAIKMSNESKNESFLFIADMHSLTQIKDKDVLRNNTYATAAAWLAFGLNTEKTIFYRQSDVPQATELSWILSCHFPYQRLTLAHSFKDKSDRLSDVNAGIFTYPMLMAADILLYDAEQVPVGKDQQQHLEMTRDVASRFNNIYGPTFVLPTAKVNEETQLIQGTNGKKMSGAAFAPLGYSKSSHAGYIGYWIGKYDAATVLKPVDATRKVWTTDSAKGPVTELKYTRPAIAADALPKVG